MSFKLEKLNFIKAPEHRIREFTDLVNNGRIDEFEISKKFEEIKKNKYSEEEAVLITQNLSIAAFLVPFERTDFQVPCGEALIYVSKFIEIEGSINLKILYSLFCYLINIEEDENNKYHYSFRKISGKEVYPSFLERLLYLNKKDKQLAVAKDIERIYNKLKKKYGINY